MALTWKGISGAKNRHFYGAEAVKGHVTEGKTSKTKLVWHKTPTLKHCSGMNPLKFSLPAAHETVILYHVNREYQQFPIKYATCHMKAPPFLKAILSQSYFLFYRPVMIIPHSINIFFSEIWRSMSLVLELSKITHESRINDLIIIWEMAWSCLFKHAFIHARALSRLKSSE